MDTIGKYGDIQQVLWETEGGFRKQGGAFGP